MTRNISATLAVGSYLLACFTAVPSTLDFIAAVGSFYDHPWPMYAIGGAVVAFLLLFSIASSLLALLCSESRR